MKRETDRTPLLAKRERKCPKFFHSYKFVSFRSKGALLALFISAMMPFHLFPGASKMHFHVYWKQLVDVLYYVMAWLALPLLGILTDTKFGRYKTLLALQSVRVLLSVIQLLILALQYLSPSQIMFIDIVCMTISFANQLIDIWFSTVIVTFGMDQLLDSPGTELSVFIHVRSYGNFIFISFSFHSALQYTWTGIGIS